MPAPNTPFPSQWQGRITSPDNPQMRSVRALRDRQRAREQAGRFMAEGARLLDQALRENQLPETAFVTAEWAATPAGERLLAGLAGRCALWEVTPEVLATLADTITPQGVVAVWRLPAPQPEQARNAQLLLALDGVRDPGNLGTLLRTAEAAGVGAALLAEGCADAYSPKVVRAGMGAHFGLPIWPRIAWPHMGELLAERQVFLADAEGIALPWELDWRPPTALIIGGEAEGAGPQARALATHTVRLPMQGRVESLNAAIAGAQLLYEAVRQRQAR